MSGIKKKYHKILNLIHIKNLSKNVLIPLWNYWDTRTTFVQYYYVQYEMQVKSSSLRYFIILDLILEFLMFTIVPQKKLHNCACVYIYIYIYIYILSCITKNLYHRCVCIIYWLGQQKVFKINILFLSLKNLISSIKWIGLYNRWCNQSQYRRS